MYGYQLAQKAGRIVFQGHADDVLEYLTDHYGIRRRAEA
jgi:hypothetical protein